MVIAAFDNGKSFFVSGYKTDGFGGVLARTHDVSTVEIEKKHSAWYNTGKKRVDKS